MEGKALETFAAVGDGCPLAEECVAIEPKELALCRYLLKAGSMGLVSLTSS